MNALRETELIGLTEDGRMLLWSTGMVRPVDHFETTQGGRWIKSAYYVLDWHGHAITAHCGNYTNGTVSVQIMCGARKSLSMQRADVEKLLLGEVIPDPIVEARILEKIREIGDLLDIQNDQPHRQRGASNEILPRGRRAATRGAASDARSALRK